MLKGLGGLGDMAGMMKKAQEMQTKMAEMQDQLANIAVTGESGAGLVKACLLYTSPSPRDQRGSRMPSSA